MQPGDQRAKSVEWYTPAWIFDALGLRFDLDPASPWNAETHVPATRKLTVFDDGLSVPWEGRVWLNPPYGRDISVWMDRMVSHGHGVALVFCRTDTSWWQSAVLTCDAMLLPRGRIEFVPGNENKHKRSRCGAASAYFAWGVDCAEGLAQLADQGLFFRRSSPQSSLSLAF